jgi:aryl-alcohol dehydrogenase-like predicted oxidoreductase
LGTDPATDFDAQVAIVNACLDQGITTVDTTYEPERVALGRILETLGRRDEAKIIAWNFFIYSETVDHLSGPKPFETNHIDVLHAQLRTDSIDMVVVHPVKDAGTRNQEQLELRDPGLQRGTWVSWVPGHREMSLALGMAQRIPTPLLSCRETSSIRTRIHSPPARTWVGGCSRRLPL